MDERVFLAIWLGRGVLDRMTSPYAGFLEDASGYLCLFAVTDTRCSILM